MNAQDYIDPEFRVTQDGTPLRDMETLAKWSRERSITIEMDADDEGMLRDGVSIHDVIHKVGDEEPSVIWKALSRLAISGTGLCFHRLDGDKPFRVYEVGLYSVRHCENQTELLRVWIVPTKQKADRSVIAPVGFDGLVCGKWLAEQVERQMDALRDEAVHARQRHDQADDALNGFADAIRQATC